MLLSMSIKLLLYETSEMRAKYSSFMGGIEWTVITDGWILAKGDTKGDNLHTRGENSLVIDLMRRGLKLTEPYLLSKVIHVLPDKLVAGGMEEHWETPRISKSNQM